MGYYGSERMDELAVGSGRSAYESYDSYPFRISPSAGGVPRSCCRETSLSHPSQWRSLGWRMAVNAILVEFDSCSLLTIAGWAERASASSGASMQTSASNGADICSANTSRVKQSSIATRQASPAGSEYQALLSIQPCAVYWSSKTRANGNGHLCQDRIPVSPVVQRGKAKVSR